MTEGSDQDDVRITWIDHDLSDLPGRVQADVRPRLSAVRGLVHAVAV